MAKRPIKNNANKTALIERKKKAVDFYTKSLSEAVLDDTSIDQKVELSKKMSMHPILTCLLVLLSNALESFVGPEVIDERVEEDSWKPKGKEDGALITDAINASFTFYEASNASFDNTHFSTRIIASNNNLHKLRFASTKALFEVERNTALVHFGTSTGTVHILPFTIDSGDSGELFIPFVQYVESEHPFIDISGLWQFVKLDDPKFKDSALPVTEGKIDGTNIICVPRKRIFIDRINPSVSANVCFSGDDAPEPTTGYAHATYKSFNIKTANLVELPKYDYFNKKHGHSAIFHYLWRDDEQFETNASDIKHFWLNAVKFHKTVMELFKGLDKHPFVSVEDDVKSTIEKALVVATTSKKNADAAPLTVEAQTLDDLYKFTCKLDWTANKLVDQINGLLPRKRQRTDSRDD